MNRLLFLLLIFWSLQFSYAQNFVQIAEEIMEKDSIPEMAFAIITKDSIFKSVIGHHKLSQKKLEQNFIESDYFHLGSNTKAITSFIAAKLVEENKISWQTKFFDIFPELKNSSNSSYYSITLEDLLSHRAKIQPFISGVEFLEIPKFNGNRQENRRDFAKYVLTLQPINNNKNYNYSNAGYSIATIMLEKVSGNSWEELIKKKLIHHLKIDLAFGWPNRNFDNQPYGHWLDNGKIVEVLPDTDYDLSLIEPGGDLSINIENYAKFIQLNIRGLAGENNFIDSKTYKFLHTAKDDYALGWANYTNNNEQLSEHSGSDGTFFSYAQIDRKNLIGYIILVNSGTESAINGVYKMLDNLKSK